MDHHIFCLKGARRKFSLEVESPMSARDWKQRRRGGSGVAAAAEAGWLALLPTTPAVAADRRRHYQNCKRKEPANSLAKKILMHIRICKFERCQIEI